MACCSGFKNSLHNEIFGLMITIFQFFIKSFSNRILLFCNIHTKISLKLAPKSATSTMSRTVYSVLGDLSSHLEQHFECATYLHKVFYYLLLTI